MREGPQVHLSLGILRNPTGSSRGRAGRQFYFLMEKIFPGSTQVLMKWNFYSQRGVTGGRGGKRGERDARWVQVSRVSRGLWLYFLPHGERPDWGMWW